ncbi:MAG TPA: hypothetical protein ENK67_05525 [Flavobacteriia bacterium]|nr:hypothetical protein [Flavobacteriia bacterium]
MKEVWLQSLSHPQDNGIVIFVSGFLFALGLYHLLLFYQNKDKAYLYYALYALLVFAYTFHRPKHFVLADLVSNYKTYIEFFYDPLKWLYSITYLLFAIHFVDLNKYNPKLDKLLKLFIKINLALLSVLIALAIVLKNKLILDYTYNFLFLPVIFVLSIYVLYVVYKTASPVKNYLLIGAGTYLIVTSFSHYLTYTGHAFRVLFYAATAFEMILFALGLGYKQKILLEEKNLWQKLVIDEYKNNLELQKSLNQKLDEEVDQKNNQINLLIKQKEIAEQKKLALAYSKQMLQLRLQSVQAQMNPHFLFNALNSIKNYIIKNDQKRAVAYLTKFSKLVRLVLEVANLTEVSLKKEIELLKLYIDVENSRFNNSIDFELTIDSNININQTKVPPMIFQALIENAIWHGLAPKEQERKLKMTVTKEDSYLKIIIQDNGIGRDKAQEINMKKKVHLRKESMGIKLTEERLAIFTQAKQLNYKLKFIDLYDADNKPIGTQVVIYLPLIIS